jgi:hypothetical protein
MRKQAQQIRWGLDREGKMPRLNYAKITKGDAVSALMNLYRQHPPFMEELAKIREPYLETIKKFTVDGIVYFIENGISLSDYYQAAVNYMSGKNKKDPFPAEKFDYISQLQTYLDSLNELAYKWKLRATWAILVLVEFDMFDVLSNVGLPEELDIPMEILGTMLPWPPLLPPLEIKVPSWAVIVMGRKKIMSEIAGRLKQYEGELKEIGLKEYPSSLNNHARWWFEHYVLGKKYKEIDEKLYKVNMETIKRKAWEFSKLVGIKMT